MDNRQRDRSLYVVQSVVRRERFDFNSPHVAFVPRQRNLPVVALDSNRQEKKTLNAVGSDGNIAASSELNTPVYNTVRFAIHKTIIP